MVKTLEIIKYRKLSDLTISFLPNLNLIAGANGTCKSSILYLISNSYQSVVKKNLPTEDLRKARDIIYSINNLMNPKIESLAKGDKSYNDPSKGIKGKILTTSYFNNTKLDFRKHNSQVEHRYSIKPKYAVGSNERLPEMPIIYLGLARLYPFGEFQKNFSLSTEQKKAIGSLLNDEQKPLLNEIVKILTKNNTNSTEKLLDNLPGKYQKEVNQLYKKFSGIVIENTNFHKMGDIKKRGDFTTSIDGIDSNTISAGEDNLFIILTALVSLKYYYESLAVVSDYDVHNEKICSILLIDELDATLHPSYQLKLLDILAEFSKEYKIQIVGTTHSFSLLEVALKNEINTMYLLNSGENITIDQTVTFPQIKLLLEESLVKNQISIPKIPVFSEDDEARDLIRALFDYFLICDEKFNKVYPHFYFVEAKIGSDNLKTIFNDPVLVKELISSICVLDGDQETCINKHILALPGKASPEVFLFKYLKNIHVNPTEYQKNFWLPSSKSVQMGYQYSTVTNEIIPKIDEIEMKLDSFRTGGISTKGKRREYTKSFYNEHKSFFEYLFLFWLNDPNNKDEVRKFYRGLNQVFNRVAFPLNISRQEWQVDDQLFV